MSWARSLLPACQDLADKLTAAGVPATLSRHTLNVPGAWVRPDTASRTSLRGGTARVSVLLVVNQSNDLEAVEDLVVLLDKALEVIDPDEDVDLSVLLPHNGNNLPACRLAVDLDLEE